MGATAVPASIEQALAAIHGGLGYLADIDAASLPAETAMHCVRELVGADAVATAALAELLAAVDAQDGHLAYGQKTVRSWLVHTRG
jgi:hypothetical protein